MDDLDLLQAHRRAVARANPIARQATLEYVHQLAKQDERERLAALFRDRPNKPIGLASRVFLWCAGADAEIVAVCRPPERRRKILTGVAVMCVAMINLAGCVTALCSLTRASMTLAVGSALSWGLFVINLERWSLLSQASAARRWRRVALLLPRMGLAAVTGLALAIPFSLTIFHAEVTQQVTLDRSRRIMAEETTLRAAFAKGKQRALEELTGASGTHLTGAGVRYRREQRIFVEESRRIAAEESQEEALIAHRGVDLAHRPVGLGEQLRALGELRASNPELDQLALTVQVILLLLALLPTLLAAIQAFSATALYENLVALRSSSSLRPDVVARMVHEFTDEEGVRLKALKEVTSLLGHAQGAAAADAVTGFRRYAETDFDVAVTKEHQTQ